MSLQDPPNAISNTGKIVADLCRRAGASWPEPVVLEEFDEFQGEKIYPCADTSARRTASPYPPII